MKHIYIGLCTALLLTSSYACNDDSPKSTMQTEHEAQPSKPLVEETSYTLSLDGERLLDESVLTEKPDQTRNLKFDIKPDTGYPTLNMKDQKNLDLRCLFVNKEAGHRKLIKLSFTVTPMDSVVNPSANAPTVVKAKIRYNGKVDLPAVSTAQMSSWYVVAIAGGTADKANEEQISFEAPTTLSPLSAGESITMDVPLASQFVKLNPDASDPNFLSTPKAQPLKLKPQGIFLTYTLANGTPFEVGIENHFTIETNSLSSKGYYNLKAITDSEIVEGERPIANHWEPSNTQENKSANFQRLYTYKYRHTYTLSTTALTLGHSGASSAKLEGGKYFVAWMMPLNVKNPYSQFYINAEVKNKERTRLTSGTGDTYNLDGTRPNTWKPSLKHLCIYGTADKKHFDEQGKRFLVNMTIERPFLPIEYYSQSLVNTRGDLSKGFNANPAFYFFNERGRDNASLKWKYNGQYRLPKPNETWSLGADEVLSALPANADAELAAWNGAKAKIKGYWQGLPNGNVLYNNWAVNYTAEDNKSSIFYALRYFEPNYNNTPTQYYSLYRYEFKGDHLVIDAIYLGRHAKAPQLATIYLMATSEYWDRIKREYPELIIRRNMPFVGYEEQTRLTALSITRKDQGRSMLFWYENGKRDNEVFGDREYMAAIFSNNTTSSEKLDSPRNVVLEVGTTKPNDQHKLTAFRYCIWPHLSNPAW